MEEFENLVIREQNDTIIRLSDVADVELGAGGLRYPRQF